MGTAREIPWPFLLPTFTEVPLRYYRRGGGRYLYSLGLLLEPELRSLQAHCRLLNELGHSANIGRSGFSEVSARGLSLRLAPLLSARSPSGVMTKKPLEPASAEAYPTSTSSAASLSLNALSSGFPSGSSPAPSATSETIAGLPSSAPPPRSLSVLRNFSRSSSSLSGDPLAKTCTSSYRSLPDRIRANASSCSVPIVRTSGVGIFGRFARGKLEPDAADGQRSANAPVAGPTLRPGGRGTRLPGASCATGRRSCLAHRCAQAFRAAPPCGRGTPRPPGTYPPGRAGASSRNPRASSWPIAGVIVPRSGNPTSAPAG